MSKYYVMPQAGVGPGGEIVFRPHASQLGGWNLFVGGRHLGMVTPVAASLWHGVSYGEIPTEWFGEANNMGGFGTRFAAGQFVIQQHGYWPRNVRQRTVDRDKWSTELARLVKAGLVPPA